MTKKIIGIALGLILVILISTVALATSWIFKFPITVTDTSNTTRTYYPVSLNVTGQTYINGGYILTSGLDTNMQVGSTSIPYMISTTNITTVLPQLPSGGKTVTTFYTGYSPQQTGFSIIPGDGGYVTTNDTAALEPSSNFSISMSGYVDTTAGTGKNLVNKSGVLRVYVSPTMSGNITAQITPPATSINQTLSNNTIAIDGAGNTRGGQRLYSFPIGYINQISFEIGKSGLPTGTANITVRKVSDDSVMGIIGTQDSAALGGVVFHDYNASPVYNDAVQDIRILVEFTGGDAGNFIVLNRQTADVSTGNLTTYAGAYTDIAGQDATFKIQYTQDSAASVSGVASGDSLVIVRSDGINLWVTANGISGDNVTTTNVTDNANNWIWGSSNTTPYINYAKESVGGTEKLWYQPNTIIQGTTLPDRDGTKDGDITWGTNQNITLHAGVMVSNNSTSASTSNTTVGFTMPTVALPNNWFGGGSTTTLPFYDMFNAVSVSSGVSTQMIYFIIAIAFAFLAMLLVMRFTRSNLLGIIIFNSILFMGTSNNVVPMWVAFSSTLVQFGILYLSRQV